MGKGINNFLKLFMDGINVERFEDGVLEIIFIYLRFLNFFLIFKY